MTNIETLFPMDNHGYISISRASFNFLLNQIQNPTKETLYAYLLQKASYKDNWYSNGKRIDRGCIEIDHDEFMRFARTKQSNMYTILNWFINKGLLERVSWGSNIYRITHYEEHCGGLITETNSPSKEKRKDKNWNNDEEYFKEFFDFYHYILQIPPTEYMRAKREWKKLQEYEKEEAIKNIEKYAESLRKPEHAKMACNYLKDKSFIF